MPPDTSQTLDRGLSLLELVAASPSEYSINDVVERLGLNRTVVYRLLTTLENHGLVRRDHGGRLTVGLGLLRLGQTIPPVLQARARPVLRALANEVGATAHFTVAEGDEAIAVAVVEPRWTDFHVAYRVGARHAVTDAAAGKAILLGRAAGVGDATPERMYVSSSGELQPGAQGIASPVLGIVGLEASVGIVSLHDLDEDEIGPRVVAAAQTVGRALQ